MWANKPNFIQMDSEQIFRVVGGRKMTSPVDSLPTDPFTILEPQKPSVDEFYVVQKQRQATNFKAPKLRKGRSGSFFERHNW